MPRTFPVWSLDCHLLWSRQRSQSAPPLNLQPVRLLPPLADSGLNIMVALCVTLTWKSVKKERRNFTEIIIIYTHYTYYSRSSFIFAISIIHPPPPLSLFQCFFKWKPFCLSSPLVRITHSYTLLCVFMYIYIYIDLLSFFFVFVFV